MAEVLPSDELVEEPSDYGALNPGTRLGRYEMLVPIARGGMARVWAARLHGQRGFQKLVAIKVILPHLAQEAEFERMFLDEARIASGVHHPNVCEIYELGEEKKTLYLVMEWVSGDSFSRVLRVSGKTAAIDPRVVARVIADACAGVHAAHELVDDDGRALGVVHRDLSPHNILLTADGTAKVCDFGVAKALGQLHEATSAGQLKGKIAYMAPEQITGAPIDRRSDVFSLGCVLYEATTGVRPFRGDGDHQVMHSVLKGEIVPPTALMRGYPQDLERIVMRALSPQPILRFPTAERMRFALEEYVARGQLVTQSNVAQVVRARIGEQIDRRKERIRQASTAGDRGGWSEPPGSHMTPSNQAQGGHRSGVKPSLGSAGASHAAARPLFSTMQMDRPPEAHGLSSPQLPKQMPPSVAPPTPPMAQPASSTTIPHAAPFALSSEGAQGRTPQHAASSGAPTTTQTSPPFAGGATSLMPPQLSMPPTSAVPSAPRPLAFSQSPAAQQAIPFGAPAAGAGQYAIAIASGVLLAAVIGAGGFYAWHAHHAPAAHENPAPTKAVASGPPDTRVAAASADITFRLTPADATLLVEGQELGAAARTVPRPAMGKTVNVVARARGYEDITMLVDFFTTSPLDLTLKPAAAAQPGEQPTPTATAEEQKDAPKDPPKRRQPKEPGVPANPY